MGFGASRDEEMIVLDTSAVLAVIFREPFAARLIERLAVDDERVISVGSYIEAGTVLAGRRRDAAGAIGDLNAFVIEFAIELRPVDEEQARIALDARIRFGRGMGHGGSLNFGDCFSYALARSLDAPLLYIGQDFAATDVKSALD
jgi:ribonuclease VapC